MYKIYREDKNKKHLKSHGVESEVGEAGVELNVDKHLTVVPKIIFCCDQNVDRFIPNWGWAEHPRPVTVINIH